MDLSHRLVGQGLLAPATSSRDDEAALSVLDYATPTLASLR